MSKKDFERLCAQIEQMADRLKEGEEGKSSSQIASDLRQSGIDPDNLRHRFYEAARAIATRERAAGSPAPLALQQAIEQMAPEEQIPADSKTAESKMTRWLEKFSAPFALPGDLDVAHAFRKRGEVTEGDQAELDELEQRLKDEIKKDHEGKG